MSLVRCNKLTSNSSPLSYYSSFNGDQFKNQPSSQFRHKNVMNLGNYRGSPFTTGFHQSRTQPVHGLKTEILDHQAQKWIQANDYPFSFGDR